MRVFFDTSAFVKRYVSEAGTDAVLEWCDRATEIGLSGIALPEMISAFCRLRREARITDTQYQQLKSLLFSDIEDAAVCDRTPKYWRRRCQVSKPARYAAWTPFTLAAPWF
jgi:predicted nucleic acid-binding protein